VHVSVRSDNNPADIRHKDSLANSRPRATFRQNMHMSENSSSSTIKAWKNSNLILT